MVVGSAHRELVRKKRTELRSRAVSRHQSACGGVAGRRAAARRSMPADELVDALDSGKPDSDILPLINEDTARTKNILSSTKLSLSTEKDKV